MNLRNPQGPAANAGVGNQPGNQAVDLEGGHPFEYAGPVAEQRRFSHRQETEQP